MKTTKRLLPLTLALLLGQPALAATLALKNVNVVDVASLSIKEGQTVLLDNDTIEAVLDNSEPALKDEVVVVDMAGKYLIPGLIDAHVHHATDPDTWDNDKITRSRLRKLLQGGVTSVRDMGGDTRELNSLKRQALIDVIPSPDIYYSVIIGGPEFFSDPRTISSGKGHQAGKTNWMRAVTDDTDFDAILLKAAGTGATGIKIYAKVPAHLVNKLAVTAKKHGLKVWGHAYVGPAKPMDMVTAGVETISHSPDISAQIINNYEQWRRKDKEVNDSELKASFETDNYRDLMATMKNRGTILDATLTVFEERKGLNANTNTRYRHATMLTRLAHENGIKIAAGTDAFSDASGSDAPMVHKEMQLLVDEIGMTPLESLQAATLHAAEVIGIDNQTGSIAPGKKANLVLLDKDPSTDIRHIGSISHVLKNGRFVLRGDDPSLPFSNARSAAGMLWLSGQIGNLPGTKVLAGSSIEGQMHQAMHNIGAVLAEHDLNFRDLVKCTLMLDDIEDWQTASTVYRSYFNDVLPSRSAYATDGLALGAKVEIECAAAL